MQNGINTLLYINYYKLEALKMSFVILSVILAKFQTGQVLVAHCIKMLFYSELSTYNRLNLNLRLNMCTDVWHESMFIVQRSRLYKQPL